MKEMRKRRLFVDMDGTLAVFQKVEQLESLYEAGYFRQLEPIQKVVDAVREINEQHPEIEVNILSAVLEDSKYARNEKNAWLDEYLPEIDQEHRIFTKCGEDKKNFIIGGICATDFLLDDYTNNLLLWHPPGSGIKLLNGINHTNGTWKSDRIRCDRDDLVNRIVNVVLGHEHVKDDVIFVESRQEKKERKVSYMGR